MSQQLPAVKGMILVVIVGAVVLVVGLVVWNGDQTDRGLAHERLRAAEARAAAPEARGNAPFDPPEPRPKAKFYWHPDGTLSKEPPTETKESGTLKEEELPPRINAEDIVIAPSGAMNNQSLAMPAALRKQYNLSPEQAGRYRWRMYRLNKLQPVLCFPEGDEKSPDKFMMGDGTYLPDEQEMNSIGLQCQGDKPAEIVLFWLSPKAADAENAARAAARPRK